MCSRIGKALGLVVVLACSTMAEAGPDWVEPTDTDAGSLPSNAQPINMSPTGRVQTIAGTLTGAESVSVVGGSGDFEDMYKFQILEPMLFRVSTSECYAALQGGEFNCGFAEFDTSLWLFDSEGRGMLGNQQFSGVKSSIGTGTNFGDSTLSNMPCDETGPTFMLPPGIYYLAITGPNEPFSAAGQIFVFDDECPGGEVSGPDGNTSPITGWSTPSSSLGSCGMCGDYFIVIQADAVGIVPSTVELAADIRPGGCPNPFNRNSNGVLPVSVLGSASFDVHDINLSTVRISRSDGVGGQTAPNEGPPGPHSQYEDNATPFTGVQCGCHELGGDGFTDLFMKFRTQDMVSALELSSLSNGALVALTISGELNDGTGFEAEDCVRLVPPGTPPGMIALQQAQGGYLEVSPPDLNLDAGGFGNFNRDFPITTVVTLQAPIISGYYIFAGWKIDNSTQLVPTATLNLTVTSATHIYEAVYVPFSLELME